MVLCMLIILAHSIIPHNHAENNPALLHGHDFITLCSHDANAVTAEFHDQCEESPVCRISGLLFHQLSQDNLPAPSDSPDFAFLVWEIESSLIFIDQYFYRELLPGSTLLRAPPSA
jgi:hypothetical protein